MEVFRYMHLEGIAPEVITYHAVVEACAFAPANKRAVVGEVVEFVVRAGIALGFFPAMLKVGGLVELDLHHCSVAVAKAVLSHHLDCASGREVLTSGGLVVITGKGNHPLSAGRRGVLRQEMEPFLSGDLRLEVEAVKAHCTL